MPPLRFLFSPFPPFLSCDGAPRDLHSFPTRRSSDLEQLIYRYQLPYEWGLLITSVNQDGPAFESGIMPGDVVIRIGDERVISEMHAWAVLREYEEGDTMLVELIRDGELYRTEIRSEE